ncbi:Ig-like domain-containing protein [Cellulomonas hominis]|uniref:Ig-like domain-containing protein n=1 Tax=Cellulomonas hominis TaxID=156981 RepID=UPI001B909CF7|nr:Ig-like domain repeat protein [Cellulomonas hominis]VTR76006.1 hypothetical protein CHMI_00762 [Cellulomonas hominis]
MSRALTSTAAACLAAIGGVLLAPPAAAASHELEEDHIFTVPDPRATGYDVDLDGDLAVYTGRYQSTSAAGTGLVQVASWTDSGGQAGWGVTDLPVPADARGFGASVAADEATGRVVVGALTTQQVVVYTQAEPGDWQVERVLTAPAHPRVGTVRGFGESVALDGDTLVVGAPNSTVDDRANAGVAYSFDLSTGAGSTLVPGADQVIGDAIAGQDVAVAGGVIAVGAPQVRRTLDFYGSTFRVGGVYVWEAANLESSPSLTSQPVGEEMKSIPPGTGGGPAFGYSLAIVDDRLYVGSPLEVNYTADDAADPTGGYNATSVDEGTTTQGAVYVYDVSDPSAPGQVGGKIVPPPHTWAFGHSVAVTGDVLLASGYHSADGRLGQVYALDPSAVDPAVPDDAGLLRQVVEPAQTLRGSDMGPGARFGSSALGHGLAVSGDRAAIAGFPASTAVSGKVYVFEGVSGETTSVTVPDVGVEYGRPATVTAAVTGASAAAAVVTVGGVEVPGASVTAGTVSVGLAPSAFPAGEHAVTVTVLSAVDGVELATGHGTLRVSPAATVTILGAAADAEAGQPVSVTGAVTAEHGTVPTGSIDLVSGGQVVAAAQIGADGGFRAEVPAESVTAPALALEARYAGDVNHLASTGASTIDVLPPAVPEPTPGPEGQGPGAGVDQTSSDADTDRPALRIGPLAATGVAGLGALWLLGAVLTGGGVALVLRARRTRTDGRLP